MWQAIQVIVLVSLLGLAGCTQQNPAGFSNTDITGSQIGQTQNLSRLKDHRGNTRTLEEFRGKAVIVFFGYTSCPDVCPTTLHGLANVMKQLGPESERVQVILITVDPEHDTQERLAAYMTGFHASFIGLRGDISATEAVARDFKAFVDKGHEHGNEHTRLINHSTGVYVFDSSGKIRLYVKDDAPLATIIHDLKHLLAEA